MGDLINPPPATPASAGQWVQQALDVTPNVVLNSGASGTVTMSSNAFAAGVFDVNQALLIEWLWLYSCTIAHDCRQH
jgi:hypothetical protein